MPPALPEQAHPVRLAPPELKDLRVPQDPLRLVRLAPQVQQVPPVLPALRVILAQTAPSAQPAPRAFPVPMV